MTELNMQCRYTSLICNARVGHDQVGNGHTLITLLYFTLLYLTLEGLPTLPTLL